MFSLKNFLEQFIYDPKNPLLFNNGFFIYFFTVFILFYYAFRNYKYGRSIVTSLFSLYFFYKASGFFVILVILSAIADYVLSNWIFATRSPYKKKLLLAASVITNLGLLFYFKYTNFFIATVNQFTSGHIAPLNILLPVGISFYTFENLSYTIDVYRGEFEPERKFFNYLLFLSFFPKLVMGPIVRAKDFIPQLHKPYYVSPYDFSKGFYLIFSGLFKKLIISDYLTLNIVNTIFYDPSKYTGLECVFAVLAYAIVIYCDFSGYSDVAIGIARWLGITIPPNFRSPYQSKDITEFWRRWHISLSSWLRDYLYIFTLGGNRKGRIRTHINLFLTMLIGGLWHGASWTFIVWGALHGTGLIVHKFWMQLTEKRLAAIAETWLYKLLSGLLTFIFVCFCWIFFKSANFSIARDMLIQVSGNFSLSIWKPFWDNYHDVVYMMLLGYAIHFIPDNFADKVIGKVFGKTPMLAYVVVFGLFIVTYAHFKAAIPVMPIYLQF